MSLVILATTSDEFEARVRRAFDGRFDTDIHRREDILLLGDTSSIVKAIVGIDPYVVALGPGLSLTAVLELAQAIDDVRPDICVVIVGDATPELFRRALRAGARDVIAPDAPLTELHSTFERAIDTAARRRIAAVETATRQSSRLVAVVSPKGGAGKTAIATNLAVGLAQRARGKVALVDLDVQFGDVGNALRLAPEATIADAARSLGSLDSTTVKAYLSPHQSGLFVLAAPDSPAQADDVTPDVAAKIIDVLGGVFPYVVVDTAAGLDEITLAAMEHATDLVVVCGTDVASARSMRKELEAFDALGLTTQQRHFTLNRADARVGLTIEDIEVTVGMEVDVAIPSSRAVPLSMNQGIPLLETDERSPVSKAIFELVNRFQPADADSVPRAASSGGLLRRRKEAR